MGGSGCVAELLGYKLIAMLGWPKTELEKQKTVTLRLSPELSFVLT